MPNFAVYLLIVAAGFIGFLIAKSYYKQKIADVSKELSKTIDVWIFLDNLPVDKRKLIETEFIKKQRENLEKVGSISSKEIAEEWKQYHNIFRDNCMNYHDVKSNFVRFIDYHKTDIVARDGSKYSISKHYET